MRYSAAPGAWKGPLHSLDRAHPCPTHPHRLTTPNSRRTLAAWARSRAPRRRTRACWISRWPRPRRCSTTAPCSARPSSSRRRSGRTSAACSSSATLTSRTSGPPTSRRCGGCTRGSGAAGCARRARHDVCVCACVWGVGGVGGQLLAVPAAYCALLSLPSALSTEPSHRQFAHALLSHTPPPHSTPHSLCLATAAKRWSARVTSSGRPSTRRPPRRPSRSSWPLPNTRRSTGWPATPCRCVGVGVGVRAGGGGGSVSCCASAA